MILEILKTLGIIGIVIMLYILSKQFERFIDIVNEKELTIKEEKLESKDIKIDKVMSNKNSKIEIPNLKVSYMDLDSENDGFDNNKFGIIKEEIKISPKDEQIDFSEENVFNRFSFDLDEKGQDVVEIKTIK